MYPTRKTANLSCTVHFQFYNSFQVSGKQNENVL